MKVKTRRFSHDTLFALAALVLTPLSVETGMAQDTPAQQESALRDDPAAPDAAPAVKLRKIILPEISLANATVKEAVDLLRFRSKELDDTTNDPEKKGINFVIRGPEGLDDADADAPKVTIIKELKLKNVPLETALKFICEAASLRYTVDQFAVTLLPLAAPEVAEIVQRKWVKWVVPANFLKSLGGEAEPADPFAPGEDGGIRGIEQRKSIKELLQDKGVEFPPDSSVAYLKSSGTLIVRNHPDQLEQIHSLVEAARDDLPKKE